MPSYAFDEGGVVLSVFLPSKVMGKATFFERDGHVYWLPARGLNAFRVKVNRKSKITKFVECTGDMYIEEKVGGFNMRYNVG